jgi:hypothetical protein
MNSNKHKLRHACLLFHVVKYKCIDRGLAVVTRRSAFRHGVSVLSVGDW